MKYYGGRKYQGYISSDKKVMSLYELEYGFIPQLVKWYQTEKIPIEALLDPNWMKEHLLSCGYQNFEFNFNDFSCKPTIINDNHIMVIYTFPEPYMVPLAKYGAILLQKYHKAKARYYTLERSDDIVNMTGKINWVLGSMSTTKHKNYGYVHECPNIEDFKNILIDKFLNQFSIIFWIKGLFKRK